MHVTVDRPRRPLSAENVLAALNASRDCPAGAAADSEAGADDSKADGGAAGAGQARGGRSTLVCGVARNKLKVTVEWLLWHLMTGWRRFLIVDDGDNDDLVHQLRVVSHPNESTPILIALKNFGVQVDVSATTGSERSLPLDQLESLVVDRCVEHAGAIGAESVVLLSTDELVVVPGHACAPSAVYAKQRATTDAVDGIALPVAAVGHGEQRVDSSRTQFERTGFVAGNRHSGHRAFVKLQSASRDPRLVVHPESSFHIAASTAPPPAMPGPILGFNGSVPFGPLDNDAQIFKFAWRSLGSMVRDALGRGDYPNAPTDFDLSRVNREWVLRIHEGYRTLPPPVVQWLLERHAVYLGCLGFPPTARRERAVPAPGGEAIVLGLLREKLLRWRPGVPRIASSNSSSSSSGSLEPTIATPSNKALTEGLLEVTPEVPLRNITRADIAALESHRCRIKPGVGQRVVSNFTMCAYVRNRGKITLEWLVWHRLLGVEHFHVFDDGSTDGTAEYLQPLVDAGFVTMHPAPRPPYLFKGRPVKGGILAAYALCDEWVAKAPAPASAASPKTTVAGNASAPASARPSRQLLPDPAPWVGFTDTDEFLVLDAEFRCLHDFIAAVASAGATTRPLQRAPSVVGVAVPWVDVGHRGEHRDTYPTQFVRTNFAAGEHDNIERVKCFMVAGESRYMATAHRPEIAAGRSILLPDGRPLKGEGWFSGIKSGSVAETRAHVIHYHVRTLASYLVRELDGFADDDNKVWTFDTAVATNRWGGARGRGIEPQVPEDSPVRTWLHRLTLEILMGNATALAPTADAATTSSARILGSVD